MEPIYWVVSEFFIEVLQADTSDVMHQGYMAHKAHLCDSKYSREAQKSQSNSEIMINVCQQATKTLLST